MERQEIEEAKRKREEEAREKAEADILRKEIEERRLAVERTRMEMARIREPNPYKGSEPEVVNLDSSLDGHDLRQDLSFVAERRLQETELRLQAMREAEERLLREEEQVEALAVPDFQPRSKTKQVSLPKPKPSILPDMTGFGSFDGSFPGRDERPSHSLTMSGDSAFPHSDRFADHSASRPLFNSSSPHSPRPGPSRSSDHGRQRSPERGAKRSRSRDRSRRSKSPRRDSRSNLSRKRSRSRERRSRSRERRGSKGRSDSRRQSKESSKKHGYAGGPSEIWSRLGPKL